jgi:hypothetical protein
MASQRIGSIHSAHRSTARRQTWCRAAIIQVGAALRLATTDETSEVVNSFRVFQHFAVNGKQASLLSSFPESQFLL